MSRGENQSRKKTAGASATKTGVNADKTDAIRVYRSAGETNKKTSANYDPAERSPFKPGPETTRVEKNQFAELRERNLAPQESQALLSMAMEISRMGAWEIDRGSGAVYWSPELEEIFGLEPGSFAGTRGAFYDLVHEEDRERILAEIENAVRGQRAYSIEFRFYHTDGSIRWMEGRGEAVYSEKDEPVRLYGVGIDITERKQAEEVVAKIAAIVESSDDAIISKDLNGIITSWNAGAERLFGYAAHEAIGQSITILIPPDRLDEELNILERLRRGESVDHFETVRVSKDGSALDISLTISPIKDAQGRVVGASKIARDITERKRSEKALIESERRFAEFMQNLPGLAWIKDKDGRYVFVNAAAEEAFGVSKRELYGKSDDEIFPAATATQFKRNDVEALEKKSGIQTIEELKHTDGKLHHSIVSKFPIAGPDGDASLIGGVAIDITERKKAEEALRENRELLAAELATARKLQEASTSLIREDNIEELYEQILDTAMVIMRSDFASIQMLYPERGPAGELELLSYRGFDPEAAKLWKWVRADSGCTCGQALRTGERAIASDIETCAYTVGTKDRVAYIQAGIRACQSTPLMSRSGKILGMISTHWSVPHRPSEHELRLFDILARQATDLIERRQAEETLHRNMDELKRFNKAMVGRELQMIGLKQEINELCRINGEAARYPLEFE